MKSTKKPTTTYTMAAVCDDLFNRACRLAQVEPTRRQYARWRQQRGRAYAQRTEAARQK